MSTSPIQQLKQMLEQRAKTRAKKARLDVLDLIELCDTNFTDLQPFVFASTELPKNAESLPVVPPSDPNTILACPFPLFSIELEDIALTATEINNERGFGTQILAIICQELGANHFRFWILNRVTWRIPKDIIQQFLK